MNTVCVLHVVNITMMVIYCAYIFCEYFFLQPDEIIQQLETQEFFSLDPKEKVQILKGLCLRIMGTYSVQDYMEEKQQEATQLW